MELMLAKGLSALGLLLSSLCFGLMVPFLLWKSRIGYRKTPSQKEDTSSTETGVFLDDSDSTTELNASDRQRSGKWESFKKHLHKQHSKFCSYDIISLINCFCGGLFLGISLLELLPESRTDVSNILNKADIKTDLPVTEFLISLGLLFVMLIEQIVSASCTYKPEEQPEDCNSSDIDSRIDNVQQISPKPYQGNGNDDQCILQEPSSAVISSIEETPHCSSSLEARIHEPATSGATRSLVLIAMLSVHSIFEGLALGLESTVTNLIQLLVAIAIHKSVIAFTLGIKLFQTFSRHRVKVAILCMTIFCIASPIGCTIGLFLTPINDNSTTVVPTVQSPLDLSYNLTLKSFDGISGTMYASAILECLATGTFVFVTFIEVIPSEFSHVSEHGIGSGNRKLPIKPAIKFVALVAGFSAISALQFV